MGIKKAINELDAKSQPEKDKIVSKSKSRSGESLNSKINEEEIIPPFEPSSIITDGYLRETFVHQKSGLLFADEIAVSKDEKKEKKAKTIVKPVINREFKLENLPRQYRNREWSLTLRLRVNRNGEPVGNIRVVKSSGDEILDQLTINRVKESRFEPAHYEGSTEYFDYTFDLEIQYK